MGDRQSQAQRVVIVGGGVGGGVGGLAGWLRDGLTVRLRPRIKF